MEVISNNINRYPSQFISNKSIHNIQLLDEKTLLYTRHFRSGTVIICDINTGKKINTIKLENITNNVICIDGKYIIWTYLITQLNQRYQTTFLNIYDIKKKKNKQLEYFLDDFDIDLYNIDNNHFMYCCNTSMIYVYDITNDKHIQHYGDNHYMNDSILNINIYSDKKHCIFNDTSFIYIWNMFTGTIIKKFKLYNIDSITLCLDEKHIIISKNIENIVNIEHIETTEDSIQYEIKYINIEDECFELSHIELDITYLNGPLKITMCLNNKYFICIEEDKYYNFDYISNPIMHIISIETNERFIYNMEDFDFDLAMPIFNKYYIINIQKVVPHPNGKSLLIHFKLFDSNHNKLETIIHMELPPKAQGIYNISLI